MGALTGEIFAKAWVQAAFFADLGALKGKITIAMESMVYLGDTQVTALYLGDKPVLIGGTQ
ncbi:MAG: hypothetical protein ABWY25_10990 [Paenisporosarcina sp.]